MNQPNELPIDMNNTTISKQDETTMLQIAKRQPRRKKQMHEYVEENKLLAIELHAVKAAYSKEVEEHNISRDAIEFPTISFALQLLKRAIALKLKGIK